MTTIQRTLAACILTGAALLGRPAGSAALDAWQAKIATADAARGAALYAKTRMLPGETEPVSCAVCHGVEGQGNYGAENPAHIAPHLAGLNTAYIGEQLRAYATNVRVFPLMHEMAAPLSDQDVADLAVYIQGLHGAGGALPPIDAASLARGKTIWINGVPGRAAACASCHGQQAAGAVQRSPEIAGEPFPYLVAQLRTMRDKGRTGTTAARVMTNQAHKLTDGEIIDVAGYVASLTPASAPAAAEPPPH